MGNGKRQILIEIPEDRYETLKMLSETRTFYLDFYQRLIVNGTPLPEGHGRLIDAKKLISSFPNYDGVLDVVETINYAPTIIEADEEGAEELKAEIKKVILGLAEATKKEEGAEE